MRNTFEPIYPVRHKPHKGDKQCKRCKEMQKLLEEWRRCGGIELSAGGIRIVKVPVNKR